MTAAALSGILICESVCHDLTFGLCVCLSVVKCDSAQMCVYCKSECEDVYVCKHTWTLRAMCSV